MRIPQPHWKESHKCHYVKLKGKFHRLDPDKGKAFEMYRELLSRFNMREGLTAAKNLTARDLLATFLDWVERNRELATFQWYRKYIVGTCGKKGKFTAAGFSNFLPEKLLVKDLKPYHLENWLYSRYPKADSDTVAGAITAIQRAFNWAAEQGYIEASPIRKVKKPEKEGRGEHAYLTAEQWDELVLEVKNGLRENEIEAFLDYITVMRETGCRPQEIRKVESRHINHDNHEWVFERLKSKGKREQRVVVLGDAAYQICRKWALRYPDGPIFRNSDGKPWTNFAVACRYKRLSDKLGFKVFAYAIRHTFATEAIIGGADVITVARLMGHKDLSMLNRVYQHVTKDRGHMEAARRKATDRVAG
jgi:integrase/recombinase XerC